MKYWVYYAFLFLLVSRCSSSFSEKEKLKQLEENVLHQHDEAMGQMDQLNRLQRKLESYLQKADTIAVTGKILEKQIADLKLADAAMMDWMHQYRSPDTMSLQTTRIYLQDQFQKIKVVKNQIDTALIQAEQTEQHYARKNKE